MANETISFHCPACGIKLTVPANLAGITGPCPSCGSQIQAPAPQIAPPAATSAAAPQYAAPTEAPRPPAVQEPPQAPAVAATAGPNILKPEPRQLPNRPHSGEVVAKQMPEPVRSGDRRRTEAAPLPRHPHKASLVARFLMLVLFLIASGALVFGVLTVLKMQTEKESDRMLKAARPRNPAPVEEAGAAKSRPPEPAKSTALPTPPPEQPTLIEPAPTLPEGVEPKSPAMEALAVLEKFLNAKTLAERLPMMETKTPEADLAASCLSRPLPPTKSIVIDAQESNPVEEVVDFYYSVDFEAENNRANPQTILVRTRGGGAPKVVADPFLDLFGGRLAAYAAKPSDKSGVFEVIVSALASCTDSEIPNHEKKLTLKLLARDNTKEIADAYFGKQSKIGEMLEDGTYSLSYANAKACTVMLRWNTEDNPKHPFLEAIAINALDWNP